MGRFDDYVPAGAILALGGLGAIAVAGWYASTVETIDGLLLLALAPLFVAGGLLASLGYRVRSLDAGGVRVVAWTLVPAVAVAAVGDLLLAQEFGITLPDSVLVVATIASVGGAAGAVGGFLAARQESAVADAERRADRAERFVEGASGFAVVRLDPEGFVETWSEGAAAVTGFPADEVVGSRLDELYTGDDADEVVRAQLQRALRTDAVELERTFRRSDGEEFHGSGTLTAIDEDGELLGYLLVLSDRSETRERLEQLERRNSQLEAFASVVSHDLRNPLNVAIGSIGMAQKKDDDESQLESAESALERMEQLIEDVLTLARQGKDVDEFERVELEETVQLAWGTIDQKHADMEYGELSAITADGERLRRLFENLFRNAIEHGGEDVEISVGMLDGGEGFFVADDGPGIPDHKRDEIFEAGYTTGDDGTGLGLAIVRSIVEAHGWEISAAKSQAGGARFEIRGVQTLADVQA
ncbi:two-component system sensor histidine kinase NtrB [Natronomonas marina]|jgi:PAS domain S-box-containing protein|uniref:two-component system sensor histidine kinase NtrB n=1 Tax=Natronomonas marina TaxID=2961939 RepID=UPI0020C9BC09|nr:PAS domain-containing sensor histidine kinase [Natronomonas marina]